VLDATTTTTTTTNFSQHKTKQIENNQIKITSDRIPRREPTGHQCWPPISCITEKYSPCVFLSELCQISTNCENFWDKNDEDDKLT